MTLPRAVETEATTATYVALRTTKTIRVPVLIISGANDAFFSPPTNTVQMLSFPLAPSLTLTQLPDTGHAVTLGRTHEAFRSAMADWLTAHGA